MRDKLVREKSVREGKEQEKGKQAGKMPGRKKSVGRRFLALSMAAALLLTPAGYGKGPGFAASADETAIEEEMPAESVEESIIMAGSEPEGLSGIQIGSEQDAMRTDGLPVYTNDKYGYTEQIYTAEEVGNCRVISGLAIKVAAPSSNKTIEVYLADTEQTEFTDKSSLIQLSRAQLVYSGEAPFSEIGWRDIVFAESYVHDPEKNLVVIFINTTGEYENGLTTYANVTEDSKGIYANADGFGLMQPDPEAGYSVNTRTFRSLIRLYPAAETPEEVELIFHKNDGTDETVSQSCLMGLKNMLDPLSFERPGYDFREWNTEPDGSGTSYSDEEFLKVDGELHLYARWKRMVEIGTPDPGSGSEYLPLISNYTYGFSEQIYTAEEIGDLSCMDRMAFYVISPVQERNIQIYLRDTDRYEFISSDDGVEGAIELDDALLVYEGTAPFDRKGWREIAFDRIYQHDPSRNLAVIVKNSTPYVSGLSCGKMTGDKLSSIYIYDDHTEYMPDSNTTYTCIGDRNVIRLYQPEEDGLEKHTLTLMKNDGSNEKQEQVFYAGAAVQVKPNSFTRDGFFFGGWNTEADGSGTVYEDEAAFSFEEDTVLYAHWIYGKAFDADVSMASDIFPMDSYYKYGFTEQIYTAEEVGNLTGLSSIRFYVKKPVENRKIELYLADVDYTSFSEEHPPVIILNATKVFEGDAPFGDRGWQEIPFDTYYQHDPKKNLVVICINNTGSFEKGLQVSVMDGVENCSVKGTSDRERIVPPDRLKDSTYSIKNNLIFVGYVDWPFTDVVKKPGNWVYDGVKYVFDHEIMSGNPDSNGDGFTIFRPKDQVSRNEFAVMLYRLAGSPKVEEMESPFTDVAIKDNGSKPYYYDAVLWAYSRGIVSGISETAYGGKQQISRQDIAVMLRRFSKYKEQDVSEKADLSRFTDAGRISGYARDAMAWAVNIGIISGKNVGGRLCLAPKESATRQEIASVMMRYHQFISEK